MIKQNFIIEELERKRILSLHESATKRQYLLKEANGQTKEEYPPCVQVFGNPTLMSDNTYAIMGTGDWSGYNFAYDFDNDGTAYFYSPNNKKGDNTYFCRGNDIVFGIRKTVTKKGTPNVTKQDTNWSVVENGEKVIGMGATGDLVKDLQNDLSKLGYGGEELKDKIGGVGCSDDINKCDGTFGKSTKLAVMDYQTKRGLKADGIVGQQLYQMLYKAEGAVPTKPKPKPVVKIDPAAKVDSYDDMAQKYGAGFK